MSKEFMETEFNNNKELNTINKPPVPFNEPEWLKLLFLLSDTQTWLDDMCKEMFRQLPISKKRFIRKNYYLSASSLAHILERHYYKINRYPHAGKFHIPVIEIVNHIREAHSIQALEIPGLNFQRIVQAEQPIGFDKNGQSTRAITILTDAAGKIVTVFPGTNNISCFHDNSYPASTSV